MLSIKITPVAVLLLSGVFFCSSTLVHGMKTARQGSKTFKPKKYIPKAEVYAEDIKIFMTEMKQGLKTQNAWIDDELKNEPNNDEAENQARRIFKEKFNLFFTKKALIGIDPFLDASTQSSWAREIDQLMEKHNLLNLNGISLKGYETRRRILGIWKAFNQELALMAFNFLKRVHPDKVTGNFQDY